MKYGLPGAAGVFIDVTSDDDIAAMWEEWDEYTMNLSHSSTSSNPATGSARLQLFVDASCGSGRSSGGSDASNSRYMAGGSGRSSYSEFGHNRLPPGRSRSSTNLGVGVNMLQLQPSTPSTDRSSSNTLAQAAALLTFQTSVRTVPSADSDISVAGGAQTFVPFFGNAKSAPHSPLNSIRGGVMGCVGEGAGEAVGGYSNDPLDLLAVLASEKAPTLGSARDAQDEGQVQQRKRAVRRSVTEPGLKMLVRQLQVRWRPATGLLALREQWQLYAGSAAGLCWPGGWRNSRSISMHDKRRPGSAAAIAGIGLRRAQNHHCRVWIHSTAKLAVNRCIEAALQHMLHC